MQNYSTVLDQTTWDFEGHFTSPPNYPILPSLLNFSNKTGELSYRTQVFTLLSIYMQDMYLNCLISICKAMMHGRPKVLSSVR